MDWLALLKQLHMKMYYRFSFTIVMNQINDQQQRSTIPQIQDHFLGIRIWKQKMNVIMNSETLLIYGSEQIDTGFDNKICWVGVPIKNCISLIIFFHQFLSILHSKLIPNHTKQTWPNRSFENIRFIFVCVFLFRYLFVLLFFSFHFLSVCFVFTFVTVLNHGLISCWPRIRSNVHIHMYTF